MNLHEFTAMNSLALPPEYPLPKLTRKMKNRMEEKPGTANLFKMGTAATVGGLCDSGRFGDKADVVSEVKSCLPSLDLRS